ncbi:MAG: hypothetical protein QG656_2058, partial [Candidatus Hydrogenedentes bacterium]|nr:hypothetical protein [Candidatus Hydrogenedentota bacterium]
LYSLATGVLVVSLEGGDSTQPELPANSQIPTTLSLVSAVSSRVEQLMDSINDVVETVSKGLDGMEPGDLTKIADDVETLLTDARTFLDDMGKTFTGVGDNVTSGVDELKKLAKDLQELTQEMRETVRVARTKIETLDLGAAETNINETLKSLKTLTEHLDASIGTIDTVAQSTLNEVDNVEYNLRETMRSATETLESLRTLTESLGEDPSQLLRGKGKPAGGK